MQKNTYSFRGILGLVLLSLSTVAFGYSSLDCENATELSNSGVISYQSNCNNYNLDKRITRAEVASVALKIAESCNTISDSSYSCNNVFHDVTSTRPNTWICSVAETLERNAIISNNSGYFYPSRNITRAEALAMLLKGAGIGFESTQYDNWRFNGTNTATWQKPLLQYAFDNGYINSISQFGANTDALRREVFSYAQQAINECGGGTSNTNSNINFCGLGQFSTTSGCQACGNLPVNAYYANRGSCSWTCNSGYSKSGNTCVLNNQYNNYYNNSNNCGIGQYATSNGGCASCNTRPNNAEYTTAGSCHWACYSGYRNDGTFCVRDNYATVGQCSTSTSNSCVVGYSSGYYTSGNYSYWNCTGTNGSSVSCSMYNYNNNYGTTGQCSTSTSNSCVVGYSSGYYTSGNYSYWNCTGTNGSSVSCSMYNYNNNYGTTGQCSTSTSNSCVVGYSSGYYTSGNYSYWNCTGTNGSSVSCSMYNYNNNYGTTGQCSTSTSNSCVVGYSSGYYTSGNYSYWNCTGTNGSSVSCSMYNYNNNYGTTGQCSTSTSNSCVVGYSSGYYTSGNYSYWNCTGTNGSSVSCSMYNYNNNYGTTGQCSTSTSNSCVVGYSSGYYTSGNYSYWNCTGTNGSSVSCSMYNYNNNYGTTGQCGNTVNSCVSGYYASAPDTNGYYNWYCKSTNGGIDQFCSVPNNTYNYNTTPCCDKPKPLYNAYYTNNNGCWSCDAGYRLSSDGYSCVY